ncbi:tetratricopeptide repeat protein [Cereibacter sp. SYSU M97828]|nr:tetratricopeptide repeat protein [Cereibacter flavus]
MSSRFPGAELAVLIAAALPAAAQEGQRAFDASDFARAAEVWRAEADAGSADAMFGLGLLHDLGLGTPRDAATALRWYLAAADLGHAEAQFNVAVMLDSGTGGPRETSAAAAWYSRAAAQGNLRAQYNLGLLYEKGEGVPRNRDLARLWLGMAAPQLRAAQDRLAAMADDPFARDLSPPAPLGAARIGSRVELAWTAPPGPQGGIFHLELVTAAGPVTDLRTALSAVVLPAPAQGPLFWRVSQVAEGDAAYASGSWQALGDPAPLPAGRIRILTTPGAAPLSEELAAAFNAAAIPVEIGATSAEESAVEYGFGQDRGLARDVASFLPGLSAGAARAAPLPNRPPGEVTITLVSEGS